MPPELIPQPLLFLREGDLGDEFKRNVNKILIVFLSLTPIPLRACLCTWNFVGWHLDFYSFFFSLILQNTSALKNHSLERKEL